IHKDADVCAMTQNLVACAKHLAALREKTGREIHVGLEPEPFCFLETTDEVIRFFDGPLAAACADAAERELVRRHLGVCLDTCHVALQFESPLEALRRYRTAGIRVSKIQISAALETDAADVGALQPFDEPVYLHQTKARFQNGELLAWPDLSDALPAIAQSERLETVRVHFHVPLFWEGGALLRSTATDLGAEFFCGAC
ncbi:MAG: sugar phosphate isomerase, partial [Kiritimatiellaeota bacterium]|nr:sugar phosphate isomerase [Kiritimatiellota bacterium]